MSATPIVFSATSFRTPFYTAGGRLRLRARQLATGSAARPRRAAARAGGDVGLAAACVFVDMIVADAPPADWPVAELIMLLDGKPAQRDRQVTRLLATLRRIEADIDLLASSDEEEPANAPLRVA